MKTIRPTGEFARVLSTPFAEHPATMECPNCHERAKCAGFVLHTIAIYECEHCHHSAEVRVTDMTILETSAP